jgi:hypothetical protein
MKLFCFSKQRLNPHALFALNLCIQGFMVYRILSTPAGRLILSLSFEIKSQLAEIRLVRQHLIRKVYIVQTIFICFLYSTPGYSYLTFLTVQKSIEWVLWTAVHAKRFIMAWRETANM